MKKLKLFLLWITFTSVELLFSQNKISELEAEDFLQDFDLLVGIIKEQHPNPYKFISEKEFNKKVDSMRKHLEAEPTIYGLKKYSPVSLIRDVHLEMRLSDKSYLEISKAIRYFPLPVYIEKGIPFVNIKNKEIPFGSEILSINDIPVDLLLKQLSKGLADGFIPTAADRLFDGFDYALSFLYPQVPYYKIKYITQKGTIPKEKEVSPVDFSSWYYTNSKAVMPYNLLERKRGVYTHMIDKKQIGILTVNTFSLYESEAYKEFSDFFKEVKQKKYKHIIIDIRNNSGGDPAIAALLYSFISKTKFLNEYAYRTKTIDLAYPEYLVVEESRNYSQQDILEQNNFMYQRFDKDSLSGFYIGNERLGEGFVRNYPKDKDAFSGNVYVLIGSGTISAATYFATLVKKNERGVILGKETTSGIDATTAAWFLTYQLPNTKIFLTIPRSEIYFFNAKKDRGRGLIPDQELKKDLFCKYMNKGKDPEMSYALDRIDLLQEK